MNHVARPHQRGHRVGLEHEFRERVHRRKHEHRRQGQHDAAQYATVMLGFGRSHLYLKPHRTTENTEGKNRNWEDRYESIANLVIEPSEIAPSLFTPGRFSRSPPCSPWFKIFPSLPRRQYRPPGEARFVAELLLDARRFVPFRHAFRAREGADLELTGIPARGEVHAGDVLGFARTRGHDGPPAGPRPPV